MKKLESFLLLILLCLCFICKNNGQNIRQLEENSDDPFTEEFTGDTGDISDSNFYSDIDTQTNSTETIIPKPRIILLGFGNYKKVSEDITFNVFFKRIYTKVYPKYIYLTITLISNRRLRNLEEKVEKIRCELEVNADNNNPEENNDLKYNCNYRTELNDITSISVDPKIEFGNDTDNFTEIDVPITSNANKDIKNIQNAESGLEEIIILENSNKTQNDEKFFINGETNKKLNNGPVTLYLEEIGYGGKNNISCILSDIGNNNYELECTPKVSIFARLDNSEGTTFDNKSLLISMLDDKEEVFFNIPNNKYENKISSSKGLTGGAIAAIVVSCVVAVIAIIIISIILKMPKNPKTPTIQKSPMEMYESDVKINNNKL